VKILHIISSGGMYGAEAVILNMSRTLNEASHTSVLGVFSNSSNPNLQLHELAAKEGIESHVIPCKGQIDPTVTLSVERILMSSTLTATKPISTATSLYAGRAYRSSQPVTPGMTTIHSSPSTA